MGEFNSDGCGQESLRRKGVAIIVNKSPKCSTWKQSKKWQDDHCSFPRQTFNIPVIQVYALTSNAEEAEVEQFYEDLQDFLEITPKKHVLFIIGDWNTKVGSQEIPGVTGKFGLGIWNEAGQRLIRVLPREHTGHSKHPLPTTQEKTLHTDVTRWSILKSDWLYSLQPKMEKLYTKQDQELTVAQIMNSLLQNSDLNWRK